MCSAGSPHRLESPNKPERPKPKWDARDLIAAIAVTIVLFVLTAAPVATIIQRADYRAHSARSPIASMIERYSA